MFDILVIALATILLLSSVWTITITRRFFRESLRSGAVDDSDFQKTKKRAFLGFAIGGLSGSLLAVIAAMSTPNNELNLVTALLVVLLCTVLPAIGGVATLVISSNNLQNMIGSSNQDKHNSS